MPFVFKKQGKYLRYSESSTHTGTHRLIRWVDRLQDATVGAYLPPSLRKELQGAEQVEVIETRTVVLKSEAEADEAAWLEAFIRRAGFTYGGENLESWARRMAEQAYQETQEAARYRYICKLFDGMKTSASERFLEALGMGDADPVRRLDDIVTEALKKET